MAYIYLQDGQVERAEQLIEPLLERKQFTDFEMKTYQLVQASINIKRGNLETAESIFGILTELYTGTGDGGLRVQVPAELRPRLQELERNG